MVVLVILNIILIISLVFLVLYILRNKNGDTKNVCENEDKCDDIKSSKHKQKDKLKSERVFVGRFLTDEEYLQMTKYKRSDISILLEEVDKEYEHLKELNK
jgi:short subunit fatty acids transporter